MEANEILFWTKMQQIPITCGKTNEEALREAIEQREHVNIKKNNEFKIYFLTSHDKVEVRELGSDQKIKRRRRRRRPIMALKKKEEDLN